MSSSPTDVLRGEIRTTEANDRLVVAARPRDRDGELRLLLGQALGTSLRRGPEGIGVPSRLAPGLLHYASSEVRLDFTPDAERFALNRAVAADRHPRLQAAVASYEQNAEAATAAVADQRWLDVLDGHQVVNAAALVHPDCYGLCLFDEQGAGKTVSVIGAWDLLCARDMLDRMLVVAPKSMLAEWAFDLERFCGGQYAVRVLSRDVRTKRRDLNGRADVIVCNFETVVALEHELRALLSRGAGRSLLVCDESFMVKNLDAVRSRALRRAREWAARAWVLCGTPAPNAPSDLVGQFDLADLGMTFADVTLPDEREQAAPVVSAALAERGVWLRSLKRDVLPDLPGKSFDIVHLDMAPRQAAAYSAAHHELVEDLRGADDIRFKRELATFAARRGALLQLSSHPGAVLDGYDELPAKLSALDTLLTELVVDRGEKVVVWSFFTHSLNAVFERFTHLGAVRYDGSVIDVDERRRAVGRFQEDDTCRLFVANPAAAGAGLTLHAARVAVFESFSNQAAHFLQSLDRIHRRGQERPVRYVVLQCDGTLDAAELARLRRKEASAQDLLGDVAEQPMTRYVMLSELGIERAKPAVADS